MVTRSLIVKVYLYVIVAWFVMFTLSVVGARQLVDEARSPYRAAALDYAGFTAAEVEAAWRADGPAPARMLQLERQLHFELDVRSWPPAGDAPPLLAQKKVLSDGRHAHWARLDVGGKPVGVLRLESTIFRDAGYEPIVLSVLFVMVSFALMIVPPLVLWVLRPLRRMVGIANRLGAGGLAEPVPASRGDEFGELERAFEVLRQRVQLMLAQRDRLLGDISHELRGPLSRLAIALPLAQETGEAAFFADIKRELHLTDALIGELLDYARGRSFDGQGAVPLDLAELARELEGERAIAAEARRITVALDLAPAPARGDRRLLHRAMGNLLDNAVKYAPVGGHVRLVTGVAGGKPFFRVEDDGPGIDPAHAPHVFEPFYRPDASRSRDTGGVGLGLAIVRAIADGHQADVTLAPRAGGGTSAALTLPAA